MKANILYYYSSAHLNTGSPTVLVNMIKGLDKEKYRPLFLSSKKGPLIDKLASDGVVILEYKTKSFSLKSPFKLIFNALKFAYRLKSNNIKLLHINDYYQNLDLALGAWIARIPIISHVHNFDHIGNRNIITYITDRFLFVSENHMKNMKNIELIKKKSSVLYNAIDYKYYASGINIRKSLGLNDDDIIIGSISQIAQHKGIDIICKTAQICCKENDKIQFIIVGPVGNGESDYFLEIKKEIEKNNLTDKIKFLGSRKDIPDFLASIDVFFLPTRQETFGLVIGEALSSGLTVITSNVGGIPEIITSEEIGCMIDNEDPEAYAREILKEVSKKTGNSDIIELRKKHIQENFSEEFIYNKLDHIYMDLIKS